MRSRTGCSARHQVAVVARRSAVIGRDASPRRAVSGARRRVGGGTCRAPGDQPPPVTRRTPGSGSTTMLDQMLSQLRWLTTRRLGCCPLYQQSDVSSPGHFADKTTNQPAAVPSLVRVIRFYTFRVRRSRGEMYSGLGHLYVCLSVCLSLHSHTTTRTRV